GGALVLMLTNKGWVDGNGSNLSGGFGKPGGGIETRSGGDGLKGLNGQLSKFWNTVAVKQSNDVTRLQALVDKKKVVVTEAIIRDALHLDIAEGVDCLPNEEIFTALARMGDLSTHSTKYISPALTQKVFANMRRVGKGCSGVETPFFEGMLVVREHEEHGDAEEQGNDDNAAEEPVTAVDNEALDACAALARRVEHLEHDKVAQDLEIIKLKTRVKKLEKTNKGRIIDELDRDEGAVLMNEHEETKEKAVKVVTTAKLITEVVAAVSKTVSAAAVVQAAVLAAVTKIVSAAVVIPTAAPVKVVVPSTRRRRGVVIRDPEEESFTTTPTETKYKDKGKRYNDIDWEVAMDHVKQKAKENPYVQRYQVMKKRPRTEAQARRNMMVYLKNTAGFRLDYFKGMSYDDIRPIFEAKFNANIEFFLKSKEQMEEEESRAIAIINETPAQKAAKRRRLNEEA
nr:hypothetical protein [Tanacetum cinerariifolium]